MLECGGLLSECRAAGAGSYVKLCLPTLELRKQRRPAREPLVNRGRQPRDASFSQADHDGERSGARV